MIRSWIKTGAARFISQTGAGALFSSWAGAKGVPVVVNYHRVVENFEESAKNSIPSMLVSRSMLEQHLDWLGRRFRFVSLDELGERIGNRGGRADPVAAVTFDDGYRDFYDHALPLLKQKGVPAAIFVVTDLVGTKRLQMHDKLYLLLTHRFRPNSGAPTPFQSTRALLENLTQADLENLIRALEADVSLSEDALQPFHSLTWDMLGEIHRAGMTVGSHGQSHSLMTNESRQHVMREAAASRSEIEARLGMVVRHFAYPGGCFDDAAVEAVADAGYRYAYTTCNHQHPSLPRLTIPRSVLWENSSSNSHGRFSGAVLNCQINHAFSLLGGCRQRHGTGQEHEHGRV